MSVPAATLPELTELLSSCLALVETVVSLNALTVVSLYALAETVRTIQLLGNIPHMIVGGWKGGELLAKVLAEIIVSISGLCSSAVCHLAADVPGSRSTTGWWAETIRSERTVLVIMRSRSCELLGNLVNILLLKLLLLFMLCMMSLVSMVSMMSMVSHPIWTPSFPLYLCRCFKLKTSSCRKSESSIA